MSRGKTVENKAAVRNGTKRLIFAGIAIGLELLLTVLIFVTWLSKYAEIISLVYHFLAMLIVLIMCSQQKSSSIKMPWIILIMTFPILGVTLYLFIGLNGTTRHMRKKYDKIDELLFSYIKQDPEVCQNLEKWNKGVSNVSSYIRNYSQYPVFGDTDIVFYDDASKGIAAQKKELKKAEKFIFMEYHAIEDAESWQSIQEILEEKVKEGVEVRVLYDDMGSLGFITTDFVKRLENVGIACKVFNPIFPLMSLFLNNRDHRKITVVDGKVGFTGGYNIANEYFNITHPFGQWKDTGVRLEGEAVRSLTVSFLEMWNALTDKTVNEADVAHFLPKITHTPLEHGFVQPYGVNPMGNELVGEDVYFCMAERAEKYLYIMTPYLIITDEMNCVLGLAAKRGVDVRIVTPGIPDKKLIYNITRSFYGELVKNGVRIYEYAPGFCHAKQTVSDDIIATCGTINYDYRSLYHHFENGCMFANVKAVTDMREDFERVFAVSKEVTKEYRSDRLKGRSFVQLLLRLVAPLL